MKFISLAALPAVLLSPLTGFTQPAAPPAAAPKASVAAEAPAKPAVPAPVAPAGVKAPAVAPASVPEAPAVPEGPAVPEAPATSAEAANPALTPTASGEENGEVESSPSETVAVDLGAEGAPEQVVEPAPGQINLQSNSLVESAAPGEADTDVEARVSHNAAPLRKGFFLETADGKFKVALGGRVQARFARTSSDAGDDTAATYSYQFSIPRARLALTGHAYSTDLTYEFEVDFGQGQVNLQDFFVNYRVFDLLHLRVGQDKKPFSRQQLTTTGEQQFVDRAITDRAFGAGRDIGIMVHNNYVNTAGFEYAAGVYNGSSSERANFSGSGSADLDTGAVEVDKGAFTNVPLKMEPTLVARVGYNGAVDDPIKGYSESDLEGGAFRWAVGLSGSADLNVNETGDAHLRAEADAILKVQGWSVAWATYISSVQFDESYFGDRRGEAVGHHVQAGYVIKKFVEPALRWASVLDLGENGSGDDNKITNAYTAGLNIFFQGHKLKWANDFTLQIREDGPKDQRETANTATSFRSQLQFAF